MTMKTYTWDADKNNTLQKQRGVSFEKIIAAIENGKLIDILENPGKKYAGQKLYIVEIDRYVYIVPFIETENELVLITIFPSRKFTTLYLKKEHRKI
jgi:uncharacterized DUF497 family protein